MLVQMLQTLNRKSSSCTLVVNTSTNDADGYFYIKDGNVIAVFQEDIKGPDAATIMLSWEDPTITVYSLPTYIVSNVTPDIASRLLEGLPLQTDESYPTDEPASQTSYFVEEGVSSTSLKHVDVNDEVELFHPALLPTAQLVIERKESSMALLDETLKQVMEIDGAMSVAIVDWTSGMSLGAIGNGLNVELAAAGNSNVVRAKTKIMKDLGLKDNIEDILITLGNQYHLIRMLVSNPNLFIYLILSRSQSNLAMARYRLSQIEKDLVI